MAMAGADGVMMAALTVDTLASVLCCGVVHRDQDRLIRRDMAENHAGQNFAQRPQGPYCTGEYPVVGTGMTAEQASHRPEHCCNGSSADGQYGSDGQWKNSLESWLSKCYRKTHQNWLCCRWNRKHNGLLSDLLSVFISSNRQESVFFTNVFLFISNLKNGKSRA
jgi:hypothetical protein